MYFLMSSQNTWGQVDLWLKNFAVKTLADNQEVYLSGGISVPAGAKVAFGADALKADSAYPAATVRSVALAAGAELDVTTAVAGSRVKIETLAVSGSGAKVAATAVTEVGGEIAYSGDVPAAPVELSGAIGLSAGTLTITVPDDWRRTSSGIVELLKLSSTGGAALPPVEDIRIVTDAGREITAKADVTVRDGVVSATLRPGMVIFVR